MPRVSRVIRALLYGASVCLSFFLMLVFMTYNVRIIISTRNFAFDSITHRPTSFSLLSLVLQLVTISLALQ